MRTAAASQDRHGTPANRATPRLHPRMSSRSTDVADPSANRADGRMAVVWARSCGCARSAPCCAQRRSRAVERAVPPPGCCRAAGAGGPQPRARGLRSLIGPPTRRPTGAGTASAGSGPAGDVVALSFMRTSPRLGPGAAARGRALPHGHGAARGRRPRPSPRPLTRAVSPQPAPAPDEAQQATPHARGEPTHSARPAGAAVSAPGRASGSAQAGPAFALVIAPPGTSAPERVGAYADRRVDALPPAARTPRTSPA